MAELFEIEHVLKRLMDFVYPLAPTTLTDLARTTAVRHPSGRKDKPLLVDILGAVAGKDDTRSILSRQRYYRIDAHDFLQGFALPDGLKRPPRLGDFPDGSISWVECFDRSPREPFFEGAGELPHSALLDGAIARHGRYISATARFIPFTPDRTGRLAPGHDFLVATLTLVPATDAQEDSAREVCEEPPLSEWSRAVAIPTRDTQGWSFYVSGVHFDRLAEVGVLAGDIAESLRGVRDANYGIWAGAFEAARLLFYLPQYVAFMYDLVVDEPTPRPRSSPPSHQTTKPRTTSGATDQAGVVYRVIRSVRVVRPDISKDLVRSRTWTPPTYRYAVRGHWRRLDGVSGKGHAPDGSVALGRTWVHDFYKGPEEASLTLPELRSFERDPKVVINVKETLAYAKAVLRAYKQAETSERETVPGALPAAKDEPPPLQWRVEERRKLSAQLRFFILQRDLFRCQLCGRTAADENDVRLEVDHKVPIDNWGRTVEDNLWTLCRRCNGGKGTSRLHDSHTR